MPPGLRTLRPAPCGGWHFWVMTAGPLPPPARHPGPGSRSVDPGARSNAMLAYRPALRGWSWRSDAGSRVRPDHRRADLRARSPVTRPRLSPDRRPRRQRPHRPAVSCTTLLHPRPPKQLRATRSQLPPNLSLLPHDRANYTSTPSLCLNLSATDHLGIRPSGHTKLTPNRHRRRCHPPGSATTLPIPDLPETESSLLSGTALQSLNQEGYQRVNHVGVVLIGTGPSRRLRELRHVLQAHITRRPG